MSIEKLTPDNFEFLTLSTTPSRTFSSSSSGLTGSVNIFARRSKNEKEVFPLSMFSSSLYSDENVDEIRKLAVNHSGTNILSFVSGYMSVVESQQATVRNQQKVEIIRFTPSFNFSSNTLRKNIVRSLLMPHYKTVYPRAQWNYANYHCLNFFTGSDVPTNSAIIYPNTQSIASGVVGSSYQISGAFSFDFYIKPKYTTLSQSYSYKPGTIMHLTGAYALSLHSGSKKDINGNVDGFRISLALSSSANISPDAVSESDPFVFFSEDNSLEKNVWQHVTCRWGGENYNNGSGSIIIDGVNKKDFSITQSLGLGFYNSEGFPAALIVGNYYEGQNTSINALDYFFAADTTTREGLLNLNTNSGVNEPVSKSFNYPLNAEIHDLKLYDKYLTVDDIAQLSGSGPENLDNLRFYLPPFFTSESPYRQDLNNIGGILTTPFFATAGTTTTPFAAKMAFGVGGHYVNLENYVRDFATGHFPRLWNLSGSTSTPPSFIELSANELLYATGSVQKRLYTVLPCDNGRFIPNFNLLTPLSSSRFVNELGNMELGIISLNDIISDTNSSASSTILCSGSILDEVLGAQPESGNILTAPGDSLAILHRLKDTSSNQVVFFDISNLFYGNRIKPGTLTISDASLKYSSDTFGMTIKDDGLGNLYRADVDGTNHATWASIGNVFYDEGIIVIKHPNLFFFGETEFEVSFKGEQNLHILTINAFAKSMRETISSSPSYQPFVINDLANSQDDKATWITGVLIMDDNLNVIMRTNLAQPLLKKSGEKFLFKVKMDF